MVPFQFRPLQLGRWNHTALRVATRFLTSVWTYDEDAYTFISTGIAGRWQEHPICGDRPKRILEILTMFSPERYNVYFCPNAFSKPQRRKVFALPSRYAWCDIDDNDPSAYRPAPNILWETSPGRHQGLWIWHEEARWEIAEQYSENIVYKDGGDRNGWSITKLLRLPGTVNHKPAYNSPHVRLLDYDDEPQKMPRSIAKTRPIANIHTKASIDIADINAVAIMRKYRRAVGLLAGTLMTARRVTFPDRSRAIFRIVAALVQAGATDSEIGAVLLCNVYFLDKHGPDLDVAEHEIGSIRAKVEAGQ